MDSRFRGNDGNYFSSFPRKRESMQNNELWEVPCEDGSGTRLVPVIPLMIGNPSRSSRLLRRPSFRQRETVPGRIVGNGAGQGAVLEVGCRAVHRIRRRSAADGPGRAGSPREIPEPDGPAPV